jgi:hypothetical protein
MRNAKRRMRRKLGTMKVEVGTTVEIGEVERDVTMEFNCYPEQEQTWTDPGYPAEAEFLGATFDDTGEDAEAFIDPEDFKAEALEKADDKAENMVHEAAEYRMERRREGR